MRTEKFIKHLEDELGYVADKGPRYIAIKKVTEGFDSVFATVAMHEILNIDTSFYSFGNLDKYDKDLLFNLILDYSYTPLEEREEKKKYHVKVNNPILKEGLNEFELYFINYRTPDDYFLSDELEDNEYKTQFTQKEINDFPDEVKEILPLCKQIEVTP